VISWLIGNTIDANNKLAVARNENTTRICKDADNHGKLHAVPPGGQTALVDCMPTLIAKCTMRFPAIGFHCTTRLTAKVTADFG
jgi:hypothetical protein